MEIDKIITEDRTRLKKETIFQSDPGTHLGVILFDIGNHFCENVSIGRSFTVSNCSVIR